MTDGARTPPGDRGRRLPQPLPPLPDQPLLSVVMPVHNERDTLPRIVAMVRAVPFTKELVIVDDGSDDESRAQLDRIATLPDVRLLRHPRRRGKGAALRTGFAAVRGDLVVVQDADLEYDPADFAALLAPLRDGRADVVYGSRYLVEDADPTRGRDTFVHYLGNRLLTFVSNLCTGLNLTDMETCYKCMRREVVDAVDVQSRGFAVEPELTAKLARLPVRIWEVPIRYRGRGYADGKKIGVLDAFAAVATIVRFVVQR